MFHRPIDFLDAYRCSKQSSKNGKSIDYYCQWQWKMHNRRRKGKQVKKTKHTENEVKPKDSRKHNLLENISKGSCAVCLFQYPLPICLSLLLYFFQSNR